MLLIPIEHQNKIKAATPATWLLIFLIAYVSIMSLPNIKKDEARLTELIQENQTGFFLETELYQEYLDHNKKKINYALVKKSLLFDQVQLPSFLTFEQASLWILGQKDTGFQNSLKNRDTIFTHNKIMQWQEIQRKLKSQKNELFLWKWAFVPEAPQFLGAVGSLFLHGNIIHLLLNLMFLFFLGRYFEDRYSSQSLILLFAFGGITSILFHSILSPFKDTPLLGASGAISALLGGYLISNYKNKIKLFYFIFPMWYGKFYVSTLSLIGIWVLIQITGMIESLGYLPTSNIGFHAHIGGFLAGLVITKLLIYKPLKWKNFPLTSRFEQKYLEEGVRYYQALCYKQALTKFNEALSINHFNPLTKLLFFSTARELGDYYSLTPQFVASIMDIKWSKKNLEILAFFYKEKIFPLPLSLPLEAHLHITLGQYLEGRGDTKQALKLYLQFVQNHPTAEIARELLEKISKLIQTNYTEHEKECTKIKELISKYYATTPQKVVIVPLEVGVEDVRSKAA